MIQPLITAAEIIAIAFEDSTFSTGYIKSDIILEVQQSQLRQALGNVYYNQLMTARTDSDTTLINDYLKKSIAYYVKAKLAPSHAAKFVNAGIVSNNTDYGTAAPSSTINQLIKSCENSGFFWLQQALEYMEATANKANFPTYNNNKNCDTGAQNLNPFASWTNLEN